MTIISSYASALARGGLSEQESSAIMPRRLPRPARLVWSAMVSNILRLNKLETSRLFHIRTV